jgi:uncharacterized membrane protein
LKQRLFNHFFPLTNTMYNAFKTLHLLGACIFIGNIIVSGFWKAMADRIDNLEVARFATRLVNLTDAVFTGLGAILLIVGGHAMADAHGGIAANNWMIWSYAAFSVFGLLWITVLVPIQIKQARLLRSATGAVPTAYYRLARWWGAVGIVATLVTLPPLYWMVAR